LSHNLSTVILTALFAGDCLRPGVHDHQPSGLQGNTITHSCVPSSCHPLMDIKKGKEERALRWLKERANLSRPQLAGPSPARSAHPFQSKWINHHDSRIGRGDVNHEFCFWARGVNHSRLCGPRGHFRSRPPTLRRPPLGSRASMGCDQKRWFLRPNSAAGPTDQDLEGSPSQNPSSLSDFGAPQKWAISALQKQARFKIRIGSAMEGVLSPGGGVETSPWSLSINRSAS